jgi:hypothetical protein
MLLFHGRRRQIVVIVMLATAGLFPAAGEISRSTAGEIRSATFAVR